MASLTSLSTIRPLKISRHFAAALNSTWGDLRTAHEAVWEVPGWKGNRQWFISKGRTWAAVTLVYCRGKLRAPGLLGEAESLPPWLRLALGCGLASLLNSVSSAWRLGGRLQVWTEKDFLGLGHGNQGGHLWLIHCWAGGSVLGRCQAACCVWCSTQSSLQSPWGPYFSQEIQTAWARVLPSVHWLFCPSLLSDTSLFKEWPIQCMQHTHVLTQRCLHTHKVPVNNGCAAALYTPRLCIYKNTHAWAHTHSHIFIHADT